MREVDPLDLVETIREGLLVLEPDLTIRFANRAFCDKFSVVPEHAVGRKLYELGNEEWDIPKLRIALEAIISGERTFEDFEVEQIFPSMGQRVMCLNARKVYRPGNKIQLILLAIEDVTERVKLEREHAIASERIGTLLQELTHRIKNSLQIIVSVVSLEARNQKSGEGKAALERVSHRIAALGRLYSILGDTNAVKEIDAATYLEALCRDLIEFSGKREWPLHCAQNRHRERAPASRSRDFARTHRERARNECCQICVPERDKGRGRGDAKAHTRRASPDGRRRRARGRS